MIPKQPSGCQSLIRTEGCLEFAQGNAHQQDPQESKTRLYEIMLWLSKDLTNVNSALNP